MEVPAVSMDNLEINTSVRSVVKCTGAIKIAVEAENTDHTSTVESSDTGMATNKKTTVVSYTH